MAKVIINQEGTKLYLNDAGQYHREDGPAIIYVDGSYEYWMNDRTANSFVIEAPDKQAGGGVEWYGNGDYTGNSVNRPCTDYPNGWKLWIGGWPDLGDIH